MPCPHAALPGELACFAGARYAGVKVSKTAWSGQDAAATRQGASKKYPRTGPETGARRRRAAGLRLRPQLPLLLLARAVLFLCGAWHAQSECVDGAKEVEFSQGKFTGDNIRNWTFLPPSEDVQILVTPSNRSSDPDVQLFALAANSSATLAVNASGANVSTNAPFFNATASCRLVSFAQDFGGDLIQVPVKLTTDLLVLRYYLAVKCRRACDFKVSFIKGNGDDVREIIHLGDSKSGVAYPGSPLHYLFECEEDCQAGIDSGASQRLTISAWPRDATSVHHLKLLVRKDREPTSKSLEHFKTSRSWFSGSVAAISNVSRGNYYITVMKNHGKASMPFVITVRMQQTVQTIPLGKPVFGAVTRNQHAYYRFKVERANTDIEIYLTRLDGDPDMAVAHSAVNMKPWPGDCQWQSRKSGDDEIVIGPDDPKRAAHPTGWFHVGVHGYQDTSFSIVALAETHFTPVDISEKKGEVIDWTELWLGLPQSMSIKPGRAGNFLFYNHLVTKRIFVQVNAMDGPRPDVCVKTCGNDPHYCPYISRFDPNVSLYNAAVVSSCADAAIQGATGDLEAAIVMPCTHCWFAILITAGGERSRFRILLGAEGRVHPLVAGESFRGHVDAGEGESAVYLAYDLSVAEAVERGRMNGKLRAMMTPVYGDPMYTVRRGAEDGELVFMSNVSGRDDFEWPLAPANASSLNGTYYFVVRAGSHHAQFRMQVFWDMLSAGVRSSDLAQLPGTGGGDSLVGRLSGLGLPSLADGVSQRGVLLAGHPDMYLYSPSNQTRDPDFRISVTPSASGALPLRIYAKVFRTSDSDSVERLTKFYSSPSFQAQWRSQPGETFLRIRHSDLHYLSPSDTVFYAIVVGPARLVGGATFSWWQCVSFQVLTPVRCSPTSAGRVQCLSNDHSTCQYAQSHRECKQLIANASQYRDPLETRCPAWGVCDALDRCGQVAGIVEHRAPADVPYDIAAVSTETIEELAVTGQSRPGIVRRGQIKRYRITVPDEHASLALMLTMRVGDADLYASRQPNVSEVESPYKSDAIGSDYLFIPRSSNTTGRSCLQSSNITECTWFVAVAGRSVRAEFLLTAQIPSGTPIALRPGSNQPLMVPPNEWQYFVVVAPNASIGHLMLEVSLESGTASGLSVTATSPERAAHPGEKVAELRDRPDLRGTKFAGVWRAKLEPSLFEKKADVGAFFIAVQSGGEGLTGHASLQLELNASALSAGSVSATPASGANIEPGSFGAPSARDAIGTGGEALLAKAQGAALELQPGVPARGVLPDASGVLCYSFRVPDKSVDMTVSVTPLTNCTPSVWVDFPQAPEESRRPERLAVPVQANLGFVSLEISHETPRYRAGIFYIWVRQGGTQVCEVDIRAQLGARQAEQHAKPALSSTGNLSNSTRAVAPDERGTDLSSVSLLTLGMPVYGTGDAELGHHLLFTSRIASAEEASKRDQVEIRVQALAGEIEVAYAFISEASNTGASEQRTESRFREALGRLRQVAPAAEDGAARQYTCRGFRNECGTALVCQVILRVRSARSGRVADFLAVASDPQQANRSEVILPSVPVHGCVGCTGNKAFYQLYITNPMAKVRLRLNCQGPQRVDACERLIFTADTRERLPANSKERAYSQTQSNGTGVLEIPIVFGARKDQGFCQVPCVLRIAVEFREGVATTGVQFALVAASEQAYTLLIDGDDPVAFTARPSRPEYFIFDSRRSGPLLTLAVSVPYDPSDPRSELVEMFVLDCAGSSRMSEELPSKQHFRYMAMPNSRGQLVALISRDELRGALRPPPRILSARGNISNLNEGSHCYYRIAVVSNRLKRVTLQIRGFDWHPGTPLLLGEPLEGLVDGKHRFSYQVAASGATLGGRGTGRHGAPFQGEDVILSMEVCAGNLQVRTSAQKPPELPWKCVHPEGRYRIAARCSPVNVGSYQCLSEDGTVCRSFTGPAECDSYDSRGKPLLEVSCKDHDARAFCLLLSGCRHRSTLDAAMASSQSGNNVGVLPQHRYSDGLEPTRVHLSDSRWMEVISLDGGLGSYVLSAEDPATRVWLEPRLDNQPDRKLFLLLQGASAVTVTWPEARLFGHGHPERGTGGDLHPSAEYELFYMEEHATQSNMSTACGLYREKRRRWASSVVVRSQRTETVRNLKPGMRYVFNVVARSLSTGHAIAYEPQSFDIPGFGFGTGASSPLPLRDQRPRSFWDQFLPLTIIAVMITLFLWARPCCKGAALDVLSSIELPQWQWGSSARSIGHSNLGRSSSIGTYLPPSVLGQTDTSASYTTLR